MLFKNASVASERGVDLADVLVDGERIARVEPGIDVAGHDVVDAAGKYLLPGGVDVHTHFDLDLGAFRAVDDFYSGSVAAVCGGTTAIVDHMGNGPKGCRLGHQVAVYHELARDAVIDYSFHGVVQHVDNQALADMEALIGDGIASYKIYMTYANRLEDHAVIRVLARARELGLTVCVHCENDAIIAFRTRQLTEAGRLAVRSHPISRPDYCEAESVYRLLTLARAAGDAPLYIVHLSTALGLEAIRAARRRGQKNVYAETCPQYLLLDDRRYDDDREGLKYVMAPPLRTPADAQALWNGLRDRDIDTVATDHCPFNFATDKQAGAENFSKCPGGIPGVEARLSLMFSEGFKAGRLTLPDVVRLCCTEPARRFGLERKGVIAPGYDADLVLFDDAEWTLTHDCLHERVDYTPYEGMRLKGRPVMTLARGEVAARDGRFVGRRGRGRFIARTTGYSSR